MAVNRRREDDGIDRRGDGTSTRQPEVGAEAEETGGSAKGDSVVVNYVKALI